MILVLIRSNRFHDFYLSVFVNCYFSHHKLVIKTVFNISWRCTSNLLMTKLFLLRKHRSISYWLIVMMRTFKRINAFLCWSWALMDWFNSQWIIQRLSFSWSWFDWSFVSNFLLREPINFWLKALKTNIHSLKVCSRNLVDIIVSFGFKWHFNLGGWMCNVSRLKSARIDIWSVKALHNEFVTELVRHYAEIVFLMRICCSLCSFQNHLLFAAGIVATFIRV